MRGNAERYLGRGHLRRAAIAVILRPKSARIRSTVLASAGAGVRQELLRFSRSRKVGAVRDGRKLTFFLRGNGFAGVGAVQVKSFARLPQASRRRASAAKAISNARAQAIVQHKPPGGPRVARGRARRHRAAGALLRGADRARGGPGRPRRGAAPARPGAQAHAHNASGPPHDRPRSGRGGAAQRAPHALRPRCPAARYARRAKGAARPRHGGAGEKEMHARRAGGGLRLALLRPHRGLRARREVRGPASAGLRGRRARSDHGRPGDRAAPDHQLPLPEPAANRRALGHRSRRGHAHVQRRLAGRGSDVQHEPAHRPGPEPGHGRPGVRSAGGQLQGPLHDKRALRHLYSSSTSFKTLPTESFASPNSSDVLSL